ncbi:hypothetical protein niasHS_002020 [Heterodera schachtii]|uniref:Nucleotide-diphospho-sugar transferase domain-containing protein n=1 Tax=Heterodera schachtii TaxID=97005 RepID=A0ABD2K6E7_HETSC
MTKQPISANSQPVCRRRGVPSYIDEAAENAAKTEVPTTSSSTNMARHKAEEAKMRNGGGSAQMAALSHLPKGSRRTTTAEEEAESSEIEHFAHEYKKQLRRILPSTYAKRLLPAQLYRTLIYISYLFWFVIGILVIRKTKSAVVAMHYVRAHSATVSLASIEQSAQFQQLLHQIEDDQRPPALLMLNQHALNMTFSFLCNTAMFPGVHERFIFVTLDDKARDALHKHWPNVRVFHWPTPSLYKQFSFAEGAYQTIYILRANLAVALIKRGKAVWFMQQDTFWRRNLFELDLEQNNNEHIEPKEPYDLLFDQIGHGKKSQRAGWVNGATFFIRANNDTRLFFEAVADKLAHWYAPDMGIMIHQCNTWEKPKCAFIPHNIANSWEWMYTEQRNPPYVIQLDCETDGRSKLQQLAKFGFYFTKEDGRTCDPEAVRRTQQIMGKGQVDVGGPVSLSWGRFQFKVYWWLVDYILCTPVIGPYLKTYLALIGYILTITIA